MPYLTAEQVKDRRNVLKKHFKDFKFSIRGRHHSTIIVDILQGPMDLVEPDEQHRYESVNHYHIQEFYKHNPEKRDFLQKIYDCVNTGNYTVVEDGDYGSIPKFYVDINIGTWDKPYKIIEPIKNK